MENETTKTEKEASQPCNALLGATIKPKITVGQEFIEWAEKYWHLDKIIEIKNPDTFAGETCDYNYMRDIFINKIDQLIRERF